jgi:formylglycine-generating enzyme required for sulfatase activity
MYAVPFRKIRAKGVTWTMGTTSELGRTTSGNETAHEVTLDRNYYIAVFETTKAQGEAVGSTKSADCTHSNTDRWRLTPVGRSPWNSWRWAKPPEVPTAGSILGKFTGRIGFQIDLPLESQWEFAARGGHGEGTWGDGSKILSTKNSDSNLNRLSINKYNKSAMTETGTCATNSYGLYDMHGNIAEFCQDWYQADITGLNGALCVYPGDSSRSADGIVGTNRVVRGGYYSYYPSLVRASYRGHTVLPGSYLTEIGARVMTYATLGEEVEPTSAYSARSLSFDTFETPAAAVTESAIEIRTFNEVLSSAFSIDTLTPAGLVVIIR